MATKGPKKHTKLYASEMYEGGNISKLLENRDNRRKYGSANMTQGQAEKQHRDTSQKMHHQLRQALQERKDLPDIQKQM